MNGFWRRVLRRKYICINEDLEEWQQKTVLCHELGHIFLHPGYKNYCMAGRTYFSCTRREDEADQFAAEIMGYSSDIEKINILDFLKNGYKVNQTY
ncbi:MAG: ImmA/IrrE family metallo-endopeptidase [Pelosinus sp.]|nr:ImmA/IrrE family metallo-endopeptidase [Pelosinus sp.]